VWVEISVGDNYSLLIGNNYFAPDCNVNIVENYLNILEQFKYTSLSHNYVR
jgi:hypothetical protein